MTEKKVIYVIENETDVTGAWTTPEKAVRAYFKVSADDTVSPTFDSVMTVEEAVAKMTAPGADYPILTAVPLDGVRAGWGGDCWTRDS